ncbi:MAG TPA: response regulator transcription factor [Thermoanaerobaculia bacterium]|nr:response regulator transcription factor [Thermoanaerobaculia bacterium]
MEGPVVAVEGCLPVTTGDEPQGGDALRLRLLIVESNQLFRECLAAALGALPEFAAVEEAADFQGALDRLDRCPVEVMLVGLEPRDSALRLIREVNHRAPQVSMLVLGAAEAGEDAVQLLEAGARGYLFRQQSLGELRSAIRGVARGETICAPRVTHLLFSRLSELGRERRRAEKLDFLNLTARELEILRLIADGLSNQEIAERLFLSVHTVKNHVHNILETLGVNGRWNAVHYAHARGWLEERRRSRS